MEMHVETRRVSFAFVSLVIFLVTSFHVNNAQPVGCSSTVIRQANTSLSSGIKKAGKSLTQYNKTIISGFNTCTTGQSRKNPIRKSSSKPVRKNNIQSFIKILYGM